MENDLMRLNVVNVDILLFKLVYFENNFIVLFLSFLHVNTS